MLKPWVRQRAHPAQQLGRRQDSLQAQQNSSTEFGQSEASIRFDMQAQIFVIPQLRLGYLHWSSVSGGHHDYTSACRFASLNARGSVLPDQAVRNRHA